MVRQGAGHRRRGRAGERGAQGATRHSPCTVSSPSLLPGGEAAVSCETHTERVLQGENGRSTPDASLWSSEPDHMLLFLRWEHWLSHPPGQVCRAPEHHTWTWKVHFFPEGRSGHEDSGSVFFGKSRICQDDQCPGLGLQMMALSKFLSFCRGHVETVSQKMWSPRRIPAGLGHGCFYTIQSPRSSSLPYSPQQSLPISSPPWSSCLFCLIQLVLSTMRTCLPFIPST